MFVRFIYFILRNTILTRITQVVELKPLKIKTTVNNQMTNVEF